MALEELTARCTMTQGALSKVTHNANDTARSLDEAMKNIEKLTAESRNIKTRLEQHQATRGKAALAVSDATDDLVRFDNRQLAAKKAADSAKQIKRESKAANVVRRSDPSTGTTYTVTIKASEAEKTLGVKDVKILDGDRPYFLASLFSMTSTDQSAFDEQHRPQVRLHSQVLLDTPCLTRPNTYTAGPPSRLGKIC